MRMGMHKKRSLLTSAALAAAIALPLIGATEQTASACLNGVQVVVDTKTPLIARAEKALNEGQFTPAAVGVMQVFPKIKSTSGATSPLASRGLRIMALAIARTEGALSVGGAFSGATPEERTENLEWAITTLRNLSKLRPHVPFLKTDLAETLSKVPKYRPEALTILTELADKDLITSAHGYAALAKLREASGDKAGGDAALKRCEAIAKKPDICRVSAAPSV
jgi:hypothetical protein